MFSFSKIYVITEILLSLRIRWCFAIALGLLFNYKCIKCNFLLIQNFLFQLKNSSNMTYHIYFLMLIQITNGNKKL